MQNIRNFSIIAHIDHGKTTLSDRLMEKTGALAEARDERAVPRLDGPRARARDHHQAALRARSSTRRKDGQDYILNLIDTPGHVDFTYEVSRSLAACEGALLVVDASQGVEAQTLANALSRGGRRARDHPRHQQDRPARGRAREGPGADRERHRHRRLARHPGLGQAGHRHRRDPGGDRPPHPAAAGRPRRHRCARSSSTPGSTSTAGS